MATDQTTIEGTEGAYWVQQGGVWRTARRQLVCCHPNPHHTIEPGERYVDTKELSCDNGPWATYKVCEKHANSLAAQYG